MAGKRAIAKTNLKKARKKYPGGRPKGLQNKLTISLKDAFFKAFDTLQADEKANLSEWARQNPREFYTQVFPKFLPKDINVNSDGEIVIRWEK